MKFYTEIEDGRAMLSMGVHSWDLTDCAWPEFLQPQIDDIEDLDWCVGVLDGEARLLPLFQELSDALNVRTFQVPVDPGGESLALAPEVMEVHQVLAGLHDGTVDEGTVAAATARIREVWKPWEAR